MHAKKGLPHRTGKSNNYKCVREKQQVHCINVLIIYCYTSAFCFRFKRWSRRHWLVISTVVDAPACKFHTDYIMWEYLFSVWIGSFKSFTLYRYIFHVCNKASIHRVSKWCAQVHRVWDGRKRIMFAFIILQKRNVSLLFWVHTNKCWVFTDTKD